MSAAILNDFGYTIRNLKVRVFGKAVSIEPEVISAQSSVVNTITAQPSDFKVVENHPLIPVYGKYRNDPTWGSFMESIKEYRRQINEPES